MFALYHTFGCKLNFSETSTIAEMMEARGILRLPQGATPDFIIINSCSVTAEADKKCRQYIRSMHKRYPEAEIVVTGCYAQLKPEEVSTLPGVSIVAGTDRKGMLVDYVASRANAVCSTFITPLQDLRSFTPSCSRGDRTRYFLKVQDGCDYWCTYCTIPRARGRSRSGTIAEMVEQARLVAKAGGKEIVITGVNIGDFGKRSAARDAGVDETFFDLIRALDEVDGIERYRISSIEPNLLTNEIIDFVASSRRFMPHFHIPLQCGSDSVLKLMQRHYDTALFRTKIEKIREVMPDAFIGVDLIVGARGETDDEYRRSYDFIDSLDISRLHVFPYSERPGTRALSIDHVVSQEDKHRRAAEMIDLSNRKLTDFTARFLGTARPVLVEHTHRDGNLIGFTDNYLRVTFPAPASISSIENTILPVTLLSATPDPELTRGAVLVEREE